MRERVERLNPVVSGVRNIDAMRADAEVCGCLKPELAEGRSSGAACSDSGRWKPQGYAAVSGVDDVQIADAVIGDSLWGAELARATPGLAESADEASVSPEALNAVVA